MLVIRDISSLFYSPVYDTNEPSGGEKPTLISVPLLFANIKDKAQWEKIKALFLYYINDSFFDKSLYEGETKIAIQKFCNKRDVDEFIDELPENTSWEDTNEKLAEEDFDTGITLRDMWNRHEQLGGQIKTIIAELLSDVEKTMFTIEEYCDKEEVSIDIDDFTDVIKSRFTFIEIKDKRIHMNVCLDNVNAEDIVIECAIRYLLSEFFLSCTPLNRLQRGELNILVNNYIYKEYPYKQLITRQCQFKPQTADKYFLNDSYIVTNDSIIYESPQ